MLLFLPACNASPSTSFVNFLPFTATTFMPGPIPAWAAGMPSTVSVTIPSLFNHNPIEYAALMEPPSPSLACTSGERVSS